LIMHENFNETGSLDKNECDEDTYKIIQFYLTDVDDSPIELSGDLVQFLYQGAPGDYYNCDDSPNGLIKHGSCMQGTRLQPGNFTSVQVNETHAFFMFVFVPKPNANGIVRLLIQGIDPQYAASLREIVEIVVRPINDPPKFDIANKTGGKFGNTTLDMWYIVSQVSDIDFKFGKLMNVTYCLRKADTAAANGNGNGNGNNDDPPAGQFQMPPETVSGEKAPCILQENDRCISCLDKIEKLNTWLKNGIVLVFELGVVGDVEVELNVNDLGNIDYRQNDMDVALNVSVFLRDPLVADSLAAATKPATNNIALIAAPIAGLLAGALIAGLIFAIRRNQAKAAVESYFDRFALGVDGATNSSPLYEGAAKGGSSPIYKGSS